MTDDHDDPRASGSAALGDGPPVRRRTVLRSVVGAGYVLGAVSALGVDEALDVGGEDETVPVALVRSEPSEPGSLEERTTTVPANWHAAVSKAFELHERLATAGIPGYLGSAVEPGPLDRGTATISINVSTDDLRRVPADLRDLLPRIGVRWDRSLEDVAVSIEGVGGIKALETGAPVDGQPFSVENLDVNPVPGGVRCETSGSTATLAPAVYHRDDASPYFATAAHAYEHVADPTGDPLYLTDSRDERAELGRVTATFPGEDVAVVSPEGRHQPGSVVGGATNGELVGQYTRWGLAWLAARGEALEKVGTRTARTTGEIVGVDAVSCVTDGRCRRGQLKWGDESDMADGDSGSVSYHPDPDGVDGALVASVNTARTWWPGQNYMWGTAAYELTERTGFHF